MLEHQQQQLEMQRQQLEAAALQQQQQQQAAAAAAVAAVATPTSAAANAPVTLRGATAPVRGGAFEPSLSQQVAAVRLSQAQLAPPGGPI